MANRAPNNKLRFVRQGSFVAGYPASTAPEPKPTNKRVIWLVVAVGAILALGIATEYVLQNTKPQQETPAAQPTVENSLAPTSTNSNSTTSPSVQPIPEPTPRPAEYIVQSGDTLGRIALRHGCTLQELANANGFHLSQLPIIRVGQHLQIPRP